MEDRRQVDLVLGVDRQRLLVGRRRRQRDATLRVDGGQELLRELEMDQSGKPSTTVQVRTALVDSTGQLVWSAAGSETAEGPYHDPNAGTMGVKGSGLNTEPVAAQSGAPSFEDVSTRLFTRWAAHFPAFKPTEAPAAPAEKP